MPNQKSIIKVTKGGRLYKRTADFFRQQDIVDSITELAKSDLVKEINKKHNREHRELEPS